MKDLCDKDKCAFNLYGMCISENFPIIEDGVCKSFSTKRNKRNMNVYNKNKIICK